MSHPPNRKPSQLALDEVARAIEARAARVSRARMLVAIVGAPGSGKSTFAEALVERIARTTRSAFVVAQDGFHLGNAILESRGLIGRKGAPETFDVAGFRRLLVELRDATTDAAVPVFDRERDMVLPAETVMPAEVQTLLVEGNYLLLDDGPWRELRPLFDLTVSLTCATETLRCRLVERWLAHGLTPAAAAARAGGNDLANARLVAERSCPADLVISND